MSVTFTVPGAPFINKPCRFCEEARADGTARDNGRGGCCDPFCRGSEDEPTAPEVHLANGNARVVLGVLGLEDEYMCGDLQVAELRRLIIKAKALGRAREGVRETRDYHGEKTRVVTTDEDGTPRIETRGGCHIIEMGLTEADVVARVGRIEGLAAWATDNGYDTISWG